MTETNATLATPGDHAPFPPGRYGRRREPRRGPRWLRTGTVIGMGLAVLLVGIGAAVALGQQYGPGRAYHATVDRFYDITDVQVIVEFSVVVPEDEVAICAVRARAAHGGEVGREEVRVDPPAGTTRPTVTHRLATTERPVTGEVQRCWAES